MLAGPDGDDARSLLGLEARLLTTFEAGSHFEAMTIYYRLVGYEQPYTTIHRQDHAAYPEEWLIRQFRGR